MIRLTDSDFGDVEIIEAFMRGSPVSEMALGKKGKAILLFKAGTGMADATNQEWNYCCNRRGCDPQAFAQRKQKYERR